MDDHHPETPLRPEHLELLRRLALNDEGALATALDGLDQSGEALIDDRTRSLVRLAGLVALDCGTASLQAAVDQARSVGVEDEELFDVVMVIAPIVGTSRLGSVLPRLATIIEDDG
ncbi:MAG TPA: carboxymuconolactone decarboxylase family protein [Acidimicrobiia bacterium]